MGRTATGVRGIKLSKGNIVVSMLVVKSPTTLLAATDKGYGKRSDISDYRITRRGGKGIITIKTGEKTGNLIAMKEVNDNDELVIITSGGMVIRQGIKELRVMGRNTQGVRLIRLKEGEVIADLARVVVDENDDSADNGNGDEPEDTGEETLL